MSGAGSALPSGLDPTRSAITVLSRGQAAAALLALAATTACAILWPRPTLYALLVAVSVGFTVSIAFKFTTSYVGSTFERAANLTELRLTEDRARDLPVYTVLVPVYREANIIGELVANLDRLDYPKDRLEVLVLMEADDQETPAALAAADPPPYMRAIILPDAQPKTKPKACNTGLDQARGAFLVIYDAEDRPDPDQLKRSLAVFDHLGDDVVCLQAALNYWNAHDNALTRMFTLEYSYWFDYMLPGLYHLDLPIPLGGTSNHFRTRALRDLGGWDPYNVTEDADLGIRASMAGQRIGIISSTTFEEANRSYPNFIRQRSRWIKGYLQTFLVHTRHPVRTLRATGVKAALGFALLIGGTPLTFLAMPPLYLLLLCTILGGRVPWLPDFPPWLDTVGYTNLILGNAISVYLAMVGAFRRRNYRLVLWALLNPLYWLLHSAAAYKAVWQLLTRPHYWEKTRHGLSDAPAAAPDDLLGAPGRPLA